MPLDYLIFVQLNGLALRHLWLDVIFIFLAKYLPYILIGVLFLFLLWDFKKYFKPVTYAFLAGGLGAIVVAIIRFFWSRPRPFVLERAIPLFSHSPSSAFPSLHATFFFAISIFLLLCCSKKLYPASSRGLWCGVGGIFFAASFLIGFSRVLAGLHWPSDILAGLSLGILCALLVHKFLKKCKKPIPNSKI